MTSKEPNIRNCPSSDETAGLRLRPTQAFLAHLESCRRCRAMVRLLDEREGVESEVVRSLPHVAVIPPREAPNSWTFGEALVISSTEASGTQLVAVLIGGEDEPTTLEVAPISTEVLNATDEDLLLEASDSPLGYPAMVEVWNYGVVLQEQVVERAGVLASEVLDDLRGLVASIDSIETETTEEDPATRVDRRNSLAKRRGVPILSENDPRALFQDEEIKRLRPFWQPSARFFADAQLPDMARLLREWLPSVDMTDAEYAERIGLSVADVRAVCEGTFSEDAIPPARLAEVYAPTSIPVDHVVTALSDFLARRRPAQLARQPRRGQPGIIHELPKRRVAGRAVRPRSRRQPDAFAEEYVSRFRAALIRMRETGSPSR